MRRSVNAQSDEHHQLSSGSAATSSTRGVGELTRHYALKLSELERDLGVIIDEINGLIDQNETVRDLACLELKLRPKPKEGRPRKINRKGLVHNLLGIYTRWTGWPIRLSKSIDPKTKERKPSGPCYRFVTTILQTNGLPIEGIGNIIADAKGYQKPLRKITHL